MIPILILKAFLFAVLGGILFSVIGVIPGTDETATMAPVTLVLVLLGVEPVVLFAWFIGIAVAMQITHTIPTAMTALPGSTMAVPMIQHCRTAKALGVPHIAMRKMAAGSLIGSLVAVPVAVGFALLLAPLGEMIKPYIGLIFTIGAIFIAYMSRAKWAAILALIPYSFLIQGIQKIAQASVGKSLFISIFMGITIGPMIAEIFNILVPEIREKQRENGKSKIYLAPEPHQKPGFFPNPLRQFTAKQRRRVVAASVISACTFTFSPVGMTVLLGELFTGKNKEVYQKSTVAVGIQDAVSNATYIGELIIPLLAFGLPLSPVALGPAAPLFNAPPVFTTDPIMNLHNFLSWSDYLIYGLIGVIGGSAFAYPIAMSKARIWTEKMLRYVSHEALIGSFLGLVCMLAFYEAGILGIAITISIALFSGILHNKYQIHTGVLFMGFYASNFIIQLFS
ncbi:hypothetical protein EII17_05660 [Clostridiales bacterium COT073_COT-073]|nr:hypothetical protein EII17_05660 [Clostridiales bacterium COT073_COT-073]